MCALCITNSAKKNRKRAINAIENAQIANFIVLAYISIENFAITFAFEALMIRYCAKTIKCSSNKKNASHKRVRTHLKDFCFLFYVRIFRSIRLEFLEQNAAHQNE